MTAPLIWGPRSLSGLDVAPTQARLAPPTHEPMKVSARCHINSSYRADYENCFAQSRVLRHGTGTPPYLRTFDPPPENLPRRNISNGDPPWLSFCQSCPMPKPPLAKQCPP